MELDDKTTKLLSQLKRVHTLYTTYKVRTNRGIHHLLKIEKLYQRARKLAFNRLFRTGNRKLLSELKLVYKGIEIQ